MIITGVLLGLVILFAVCIVFWFMKGSQTELKEAGVHLDPIDPANEPWPFPIAMPQHDRAKRKPSLKKATIVAKKTTSKEKTMPLIKSAKPAAFKKNVAAEVKSGKPVKQAVAIAYSEAREAKKTKAKKK